MNNFPAVFGAVIAYILLILYACTVGYMTYEVIWHGTKEFNSGITYVVTTVGGLVSALVIARLAITQRGDVPALVPQVRGAAPPGPTLNLLAAAYLIGWLLTGLTALVVGAMCYPDVNKSLGEIGTTWLGLAVASGYAYFGLNPPPNHNDQGQPGA